MTFKKIDLIFIIIIAIVTIIAIDLLVVVEHQAAMTNIWDINTIETTTYTNFEEELLGRLVIVFVVCVVGNLLPIPTPYSWAVCLGAAFIVTSPFLPILFALVAACGCLVGEIVGYIVGRGAAEVISEERAQNLDKYQQYFLEHPKLAPFLIYLFGATPLNDDMLTVPLGLIKYSATKTIIWIWLGKFTMMMLFAYNILNLCNLIGGENWISSIIFLYIVVIMIYVMIRVDLGKVFGKKIKTNPEA